MFTLETPIEKLVGIGPKMARRLSNLGLFKVSDLLFYFPRRWDDFSQIVPISQIRPGAISLKGKILAIKNQRSPKGKMVLTHALISDNSGTLRVLWFNQPWISGILKKGEEVVLSGKVKYKKNGLILENPVYEKLDEDLLHVGRIVPVYSETEGVTSRWLRRIIKPLLSLTSQIPEFLPEEVKKRQGLMGLSEAIREIHFPDSQKTLKEAKKRLSFDELFLIQLKLLSNKKEIQRELAPKIKIDEKLCQDFVRSLPFKLTNAQRKAAWQILKDIEKTQPMNRLLEGDVGSGKTVVAALACLNVIKSGYQVAFMAPTEILAFQHYKTLSQLLRPFSVKIGLLTSSQKIGDGELILGTHALIQKNIKFKNLGLAIVDEQHRFGVRQRGALRQQGAFMPHLLSMTATPIPRTLALALYGDLDISVLDEMPPGRKEIITKIVAPTGREKAYQFIREQVKKGFQAFVICPLIEDSEKLQTKAAEEEYEKLSQEVFPDLKIGLIHGRLKSKEKEGIMRDFASGRLDILVATPVVEVGIDVPKATLMIIEGGERFGLASLHQFRGRVGRREYPSYCFVFTETWNQTIRKRLKAFKESQDGFALAERDLEIRGPGELYGIRQHGFYDLKMASLTDIIMVQKAREEAEKLVQKGIEKYPVLLEKLREFEIERHLE